MKSVSNIRWLRSTISEEELFRALGVSMENIPRKRPAWAWFQAAKNSTGTRNTNDSDRETIQPRP